MKYYLIAGEASGDLHGANLMRGLKKADPGAEFRFWGGDRMAEQGGAGALARHYNTASFFGLLNVALHIRTIARQMRECREDVLAFAPDVLILVDYPGFNLRMARFARERGIRTFYYISPKVWAWKEGRVKKIRRYVDRLFIIFPFEAEYFRSRGVEAVFEGNPIVDALSEEMAAMPSREEFLRANALSSKPVVALLAGSRSQEIRHNLPFMAELAERFADYQFVVAGVDWLPRELYDRHNVRVVFGQTYPLLRYAEAAVVASGTATLEAALIGTPEFVCYRVDGFSMMIARLFLKIRYVSLVNIIMGREVVRELLQEQMSRANADAELRAILPGGARREAMLADFDRLRRLVGGPGASDRFAAKMVSLMARSRQRDVLPDSHETGAAGPCEAENTISE
ncbi:MAG: lipid-A-disaccharide synthase [Rikenellaceae bacterium]|jgi:lipid-A-disaccharide synthase|nr:lipid-A-disaccharide synthase [Rikenellaceae bacterium]